MINASEITLEAMNEIKHYPVMYREVVELLDLSARSVVVDCTVGTGEHAYKILEAMPQNGFLVGIDRDDESLGIARERLSAYPGRFTLVKSDFASLEKVLESSGLNGVDGFLFDLGISTYQLSKPERGFSFAKDGPLDMRMSRDSFLTACDLVNNLSENELANMFRKFGQERHSRRIAWKIVKDRAIEPITTTSRLAEVVAQAVGNRNRNFRLHPATRVFQALRIAVNRELEVLEQALHSAVKYLNPKGRLVVISFHSLEDRIVKHTFRGFAGQGLARIITKKPLVPAESEAVENSASRSAKLRAIEKI